MARTEISDPNVTVEELAPAEYQRRTVTVDFLFLDREVCERCGGTDDSIHAALDRVAPLLDDLGVGIVVRKVHVRTEADARETGLEISPTVRIDGNDLQPNYVDSPCESCGELCTCGEGFDDDAVINCRSWRYQGHEYETPPVGLLVEGLIRAAVVDDRPRGRSFVTEWAQLPENLRHFFGRGRTGARDVSDEDGVAENGETCC